MKTNKLLMAILAGTLAFAGIIGCGEDETDPDFNGGTGGTVNTGGTGGGDGNDGGGGGTDDPACENTRTDCDECVTWEEDPHNACVDATDNCLPFDNAARVPGYPNVPAVP